MIRMFFILLALVCLPLYGMLLYALCFSLLPASGFNLVLLSLAALAAWAVFTCLRVIFRP